MKLFIKLSYLFSFKIYVSYLLSPSFLPLLPPAASSCRCRCFGCCVIRPRAAGTEGLGLRTPRPLPALSPTSRRALLARGGSPQSPTSASARLPVSPAVTGKEAAGGARGGVGQEIGGRPAGRRRENLTALALGWGGPTQVPCWTCRHGE